VGWPVLGLPPAGARGVRGDSKEVCAWHEVGMSFARVDGTEVRPKRRYARMKVLIGVDPHKASLAVAAVDEATSELLERAAFPQDRSGLRSLERWARRFPERRWAVENAGGLGRHLAVRLAAAGESVVDVSSPSSRRGCGCSRASLATPARTTASMPWPARLPPRATKGWRRSIPSPPLRRYDCSPRGAY
jgi:hypothetical protein